MLALPVPARLYSVTDCKSQCPVTVKEGRELFAKYSKNNSFTEHTLQNNNSDDEILSVKMYISDMIKSLMMCSSVLIYR